MANIKVGGSGFSWNEVETDFKYAKEVSNGINRAVEFGFNNCPVLQYISVNKLCLNVFNNIIENYTDENLLNWFRTKIRNGDKIGIKELDISECISDYALETMYTTISQKQNKFNQLVVTI